MATEKLSNQGFVSNYIGSDNTLYVNNFEIKTGETSGDKIKYTRMIYTRRKK